MTAKPRKSAKPQEPAKSPGLGYRDKFRPVDQEAEK